MDASLQTLTIAETFLLALAPVIFVTAALKIRLAWLDEPFSRRTNPVLYWIEIAFGISIVGALLIVISQTTTSLHRSGYSLLSAGTVFAMNAGTIALGWWRPSKSSEVGLDAAHEGNGGSLIVGIVVMCLAIVITLLAYCVRLGALR